MKPLFTISFLLFNLFIVAQKNYFHKAKMCIYGEIGDFGAGFSSGEKGKGLSVAFIKPIKNHFEISARLGLKTAASSLNFSESRFENIKGNNIFENSISNFHIGVQSAYVLYDKDISAFRIKAGFSYSSKNDIGYIQTFYITENEKSYHILYHEHNKTKIIDITGGIEYERKINDNFSAGFEFGFFLKEGFPFGSIFFGTAL